MKRSKTSKAWMKEHVTDPYVQRASLEGYRSRAAYKLIEIDEKFRLLGPGMRVVDLGAAPGSWSQVVAKRIFLPASGAQLFALDLLAMFPIAGVDFLQGDFQEKAVLNQLVAALNGKQLDVVLSDMAPNISGISSSDQARAMYLVELALDFALTYLTPGGSFLVKVFQGSGFMSLRETMQRHFATVKVRKPQASRDRSPEVYLLGQCFRQV